jgi:hypothetical protein
MGSVPRSRGSGGAAPHHPATGSFLPATADTGGLRQRCRSTESGGWCGSKPLWPSETASGRAYPLPAMGSTWTYSRQGWTYWLAFDSAGARELTPHPGDGDRVPSFRGGRTPSPGRAHHPGPARGTSVVSPCRRSDAARSTLSHRTIGSSAAFACGPLPAGSSVRCPCRTDR